MVITNGGPFTVLGAIFSFWMNNSLIVYVVYTHNIQNYTKKSLVPALLWTSLLFADEHAVVLQGSTSFLWHIFDWITWAHRVLSFFDMWCAADNKAICCSHQTWWNYFVALYLSFFTDPYFVSLVKIDLIYLKFFFLFRFHCILIVPLDGGDIRIRRYRYLRWVWENQYFAFFAPMWMSFWKRHIDTILSM